VENDVEYSASPLENSEMETLQVVLNNVIQVNEPYEIGKLLSALFPILLGSSILAWALVTRIKYHRAIAIYRNTAGYDRIFYWGALINGLLLIPFGMMLTYMLFSN